MTGGCGFGAAQVLAPHRSRVRPPISRSTRILPEKNEQITRSSGFSALTPERDECVIRHPSGGADGFRPSAVRLAPSASCLSRPVLFPRRSQATLPTETHSRRTGGTVALTPEQGEYLKNHRLGVLATGRQDGSPQVSTIMYRGHRHLRQELHRQVEQRAAAAQGRRARQRRPQAAGHLWEAKGIGDDPERKGLTRRMHVAMDRKPDDENAFVARLNQEKRTVLRIRPDKAFIND